jgi:hypothetical protein
MKKKFRVTPPPPPKKKEIKRKEKKKKKKIEERKKIHPNLNSNSTKPNITSAAQNFCN